MCQALCNLPGYTDRSDPFFVFLEAWSVRNLKNSCIIMNKATGGDGIPSQGDLPNPGIKPKSPTLQADALPSEPPGKNKKQL